MLFTRKMPMKIRKKLKITLIFAIVCLVLVISASYAWITLSLRPEVTSIDTNVGANGSLEIALLSRSTYTDPLLIRTTIGDSAVEQDALESNQHWGNVIELADERYGLGEISLLPARLNAAAGEDGPVVSQNLLNVAEFGIDGRISILSESTVSAIRGEKAFTYYVDQQNYGVRAIGTISSLSEQQIALAEARSLVPANTASAARTVKHTWRDFGPGLLTVLHEHYAAGSDTVSPAGIAAIRDMANGMLDALNYTDTAIRYGIVGIAASQISDEPEFADLRSVVIDPAVPLSAMLDTLGSQIPAEFRTWITQLDRMKTQVQALVAESYLLSSGASWEEVEPLLDVLLDADKAYLGETILSHPDAFRNLSEDNLLTVAPGSGLLADIAAYAGNYSTFCIWTGTVSVELRSADPNNDPYLIRIEKILDGCKAASGGWTRANLDDTYGFAVDLAFRSNVASDLLLQTTATLRVAENSEFPVTQGGGSYMRFVSDDMETEELLALMDTIRIGFLDDSNTLVALAKLNISNYEEQEEGVFAPLYLYDFTLEADGSLTTGQRRTDDAAIIPLPQNSPKILTAVVWLDGDQVENSTVNENSKQSMSGVLNLQFASSADLLPSSQSMKEKK